MKQTATYKRTNQSPVVAPVDAWVSCSKLSSLSDNTNDRVLSSIHVSTSSASTGDDAGNYTTHTVLYDKNYTTTFGFYFTDLLLTS